MGKLTKRFVEAAPARDKAYILWDGDIPGFGVRVLPSGRKTFVLRPALAHHEPRLHPSDHAG